MRRHYLFLLVVQREDDCEAGVEGFEGSAQKGHGGVEWSCYAVVASKGGRGEVHLHRDSSLTESVVALQNGPSQFKRRSPLLSIAAEFML